jgi:hypothetical protein
MNIEKGKLALLLAQKLTLSSHGTLRIGNAFRTP